MRFAAAPIAGAYLIELEPAADERGFFARTFCRREFEEHGLVADVVQCDVSFNRARGTLRGLHYQLPPACEAKLVRPIAGAIFAVVVDLRPGSPTCRQHFAVELDARSRRAIYVPHLFAFGYQTLRDETEVFYQMSAFYAPDKAAGVRFDDPALGIAWPLAVTVLSERDRTWPLLR